MKKKLFSVLCVCILSLAMGVAYASSLTKVYSIWGDVEKLSTADLELLQSMIGTELLLREKGAIEEPTQETAKPEDLGIWAEKFFVDSFKEPTDEKYITTKTMISGTFSNSAATDKQLNVKLLISGTKEPTVALELYKYGDSKVKNSGTQKDPYTVSIRDDAGKTHYFTFYMPKKGERLYIDKEAWFGGKDRDFIELLKNSQKLKVNITDDDKYSVAKYNFTIEDTTGFENAYNWLGIPDAE